MIFLNKGEAVQVRLNNTNPGYAWKLLYPGETIDLPESVGRSYGFEIVKSTTGKVGNLIVETKQKEVLRGSEFLEELKEIKGIGIYTAEDIINIFKTKENLIYCINNEGNLPLRNDIEKKLREYYG